MNIQIKNKLNLSHEFNLISNLRKKFLLLSFPIIFAVLIGFFFSSCTSTPPAGKTEAEVLYKEALDYVKKERYLLATEKINAIKSQYPYSFYATHAELLQADIFFVQENYMESASAYILFKDLHPKHEKLGYVIWRIAESYYFQLPTTFDRDLSAANEAIRYYRDLVDLFPQSEFIEKSKERIVEINHMLMNKDLYIADFYFKTEVYDSARFRYLDLIKKYEDNAIKEHAILRVLESLIFLKEFDQCLKSADEFKSSLNNESLLRLDKLKEECRRKI